MSALSIDDLHKLKTLAVVAMNRACKDAEALAGADFLAALHRDGFRAQPQLGGQAKRAGERVKELAALADRVGIVLDAQLVAADPDGTNYPAAHARVRERAAAPNPAKGPVLMSASEDTAMAARLTMLADLDDQLTKAAAATRRLRLGYDALAALVRAEFPAGLSLAEIAATWPPEFGENVTEEMVQALRDIEAADEASWP